MRTPDLPRARLRLRLARSQSKRRSPRLRAATERKSRLLERESWKPSIPVLRLDSASEPIAIALIRLTKANSPGNAATVGHDINKLNGRTLAGRRSFIDQA